jgi:hypothetical protein
MKKKLSINSEDVIRGLQNEVKSLEMALGIARNEACNLREHAGRRSQPTNDLLDIADRITSMTIVRSLRLEAQDWMQLGRNMERLAQAIIEFRKVL